jgi:N4-gp56 family major capsid protein
MIDKAVAVAKTSTPLIRPITGQSYDYVAFIHPYQTYSLRQSTGTTGSWGDLTKAMLQGGQSLDKNMFGSGALGIFNRTLIVENSRVPLTATNIRRAVFCGAQSAVMAVGQNNSPEKMSWVEELFDYENQLGVSAGMIFGAKKCIFNSLDFGTITMPSYAVAPA